MHTSPQQVVPSDPVEDTLLDVALRRVAGGRYPHARASFRALWTTPHARHDEAALRCASRRGVYLLFTREHGGAIPKRALFNLQRQRKQRGDDASEAGDPRRPRSVGRPGRDARRERAHVPYRGARGQLRRRLYEGVHRPRSGRREPGVLHVAVRRVLRRSLERRERGSCSPHARKAGS